MNQQTAPSRRLIVLGSTGTIGAHSLEVVEHLDPLGHTFTIVGLAAHKNAEKLIEQARRYPSATLAIGDPRQAQTVRKALPSARIISGPSAAQQLVEQTDATDLLVAVVGSAALPATLTAIGKGIHIALANKETLVAAGQLVMSLTRKHGCRIIPVDSEHSAIFQCLAGQQASTVKRIVLTASGGPFRNADQQTIEDATIEQALAHPTWRMGPKISIDSATMMNKALEIIEAHWLFGMPESKIDVVIHPQSLVHSFVEFQDHSVLAQLGPPDMRMPIQYALTYPQRVVGCSQALDWTTLTELTFEVPDYRRFPALKLAYDVIRAGGTAGAVFNAANEQAVAAFLAGRIRFGRIVALVAEALGELAPSPADSLEAVLAADRLARDFVKRRIDA
jgi:1-deoxy-D-xylulose-5-phosphate reductoisomerase